MAGPRLEMNQFQSGAGAFHPRPLRLTAELHLDTNRPFNLPLPSLMNLAAPPLIAKEVGFDQFKAAVLRRQIEITIARGGQHFPPVPETDLVAVDGDIKHKLRRGAAAKCMELLAKARSDAKTKGPKHITIGVVSAYRSYEYDNKLWNRYFVKYYRATQRKRQALRGGEHGPAAIDFLARYTRGKKAPPGFSNHSNGKAIDFTTKEDGTELGPDTSPENRAAWRDSWLYKWLAIEKNGAKFSFKQLVTEEWHWDFQG